MDWETLFAFTGTYILLVGIFYFLFTMSRRLFKILEKDTEIDKAILQVSHTNQKILKTLKLLTSQSSEKESYEERKKRVEESIEEKRLKL